MTRAKKPAGTPEPEAWNNWLADENTKHYADRLSARHYALLMAQSKAVRDGDHTAAQLAVGGLQEIESILQELKTKIVPPRTESAYPEAAEEEPEPFTDPALRKDTADARF